MAHHGDFPYPDILAGLSPLFNLLGFRTGDHSPASLAQLSTVTSFLEKSLLLVEVALDFPLRDVYVGDFLADCLHLHVDIADEVLAAHQGLVTEVETFRSFDFVRAEVVLDAGDVGPSQSTTRLLLRGHVVTDEVSVSCGSDTSFGQQGPLGRH